MDEKFKLHNNLILSKFSKKNDINELSFKVFLKCIFNYKEQKEDFFKNQILIKDINKSKDYKEIKKSVINLQSQVIILKDNEKEKHFKTTNIFDFLEYKSGVLSYDFKKEIKSYILDIKKNFTLIDFNNIIKLNSVYSIKLYLLLKKDLYYNKRFYELDELYNYLDLKEYNREYKNFKRYILTKSLKDITDNTTLKINNITEVKENRKTISLKIEREEKEIDFIDFIKYLKSNYKNTVLCHHKEKNEEYFINNSGYLTVNSLVIEKDESIEYYKYIYHNRVEILKSL